MAVHTVAAALGLSALLGAAPAALDAVRIGGPLLLLYLAISTLVHQPGTGPHLRAAFSAFRLRRAAIQNWIKRVSAAILGGLAVRQFLSD